MDDSINKIHGHLIIIGGAEDKKGKCTVLNEVVKSAGGNNGHIVVMTTATKLGGEVGREYRNIFSKLGVGKISTLDIKEREEASYYSNLDILEQATCIFFTGGDQVRITSLLGGTPVCEKLKQIYLKGIPLVGTSAGASVMSSTMIVGGQDNDTPRKCTVNMSPGLGFVPGAVIDQHFAQRGRIGRLITALAQNPNMIGIGIDENTAIDVNADGKFKVLGDNAVTVLDGSHIDKTNVSELKPDEILVLSDIRLHIIPKGYGFDMRIKEVFKEDE
jgi:cyanophycinase